MSESFISDISDEYLKRTAELLAAGKSDQTVANELGIRRHQARKLIEKVKLDEARKEQRGELEIIDPEPETIPEFVEAINKCLRKSVEGMREAGRHLANAKEKHRGEFVQMVERDLGMSARMAQQLMAIARDERIANYSSHLPIAWRSVYELTRLDDEEFEQAIDSGAINPEMSQQDAIRLKNPVAAPPEGEGPPAAADPEVLRESSSAAAVPPHQGTGIRNQESESEVMPSDTGRASPETDNRNTSPRSVVNEQGRAQESAPSLPNGHRAIAPSRTEPSDSLDFFPTPPWATRALMERVLPRLGIRHADSTRIVRCWEPACGEGHMAEVLKEYAPFVMATDIHDYGYGGVADFFCSTFGDLDAPDWIITNPPFGDKSVPFLLRALELAQIGVAIFVRSQWAVEGINKYEHVYRDRPPTLFAPFMERVNLCKGRWDPDGTTATAYCWLIWVKNKAPKPPYWIPPGCRESLTMPDDAERFTAHPVKRKEPNPASDAVREGEARSGNAEMESIGPPHSSSGEMPDMPEFLDRRKERTESN